MIKGCHIMILLPNIKLNRINKGFGRFGSKIIKFSSLIEITNLTLFHFHSDHFGSDLFFTSSDFLFFM